MKTAREIAAAIHALISAQSRLPTVDEIEAMVAACQAADNTQLTPEQTAAWLRVTSGRTTAWVYGSIHGDGYGDGAKK